MTQSDGKVSGSSNGMPPAEWSGRAEALDANSVQQQFEAQVLASPGAIALICGTVRLSYTELNLRANRIAHRLHATGCRRGAAVAVLLDRGPDLIASLLGVLKAGAYYVPIDLEYPGERIEFILGDCAPAALIAHTRSLAKFKAGNTAVIALDGSDATVASDANPVDTGTPDDPVYAIYTSGSTGAPKGVVCEHGALAAYADAKLAAHGIGEGARVLLVSAATWDPSGPQPSPAISPGCAEPHHRVLAVLSTLLLLS